MSGATKAKLIGLAIVGGILALLVFLARPWFQGIALTLWAGGPAFAVLWGGVVVGLLILIFGGFQSTTRYYGSSSSELSGVGVLGVGIATLCIILGVILSIIDDGLSKQSYLEYNNITAESGLQDTEGYRHTPYDVASTLMSTKQNLTRVQLGDTEPYIEDNSISYISPLEPSSGFNNYAYEQQGVVKVDDDGNYDVYEYPFKYGEGMRMTFQYDWQLAKNHFWADYQDPYYTLVDEQPLMVVPYVKYRFDFPVMVPYWAGVSLVHPDGTVEDLSVEEAIADSRLDGQRLFPHEMAEYAANAVEYRNGFWAAWLSREGVPEIPRLEDSPNQFPFLLPSADGGVWWTGFEPSGPSYSIYLMQYIDAHTGEHRLYEPGVNFVGPNKVTENSYVQNAFPEQNWQKFGVYEPRPIVRDGVLYWQLSVMASGGTSVQMTAFVEAESGDVIAFEDYDKARAFAEGEDVKSDVKGSDQPEGEGATEGEGRTPDEVIAEIESLLEELKQ